MPPTKDNPESIVIVDDTLANLEVIVAYLAEAGFQTMAARTDDAGLRRHGFRGRAVKFSHP